MRSAPDIDDVGWPELAAALARTESTRSCCASAGGVGAGSHAAQRDRGLGRHEVVEDQELHERQRLGALKVVADCELAEPVGAEVRGEVELLPDRLLDLGGLLAL